MPQEDNITYFGITDYRGKQTQFGIKDSDRVKHVYVIGKTGMGKSTLLENMAVQDIQNGNGLAFIDPHGGSAEELLNFVPEERIDDIMYFAPFDMEYPISFNVMEDVGADKRHLVANGLMAAFKKIWVDAWSARMEYILNNILLALLEFPGSTLIGVNRMLADKKYRDQVVSNVTDVSVKAFWEDEFAKYSDRFMVEAGAAIQNKIGQFISNPLVRNIIGQPKSSFDIRELMDSRKIVIINLSKGKVGDANANLLGSMLITKIYLGAMSRADVSRVELNKLPNFYLYVDEFQSFANESFAEILSEARKYKLNLTIAHQYIEQMSDEVRAAVFGNVGTFITFRVGAIDAEILEKEFAPEFTAEDLVNLGKYQMYLKLMVDGVGSAPFSANSMPPIEAPRVSYADIIMDKSRKKFSKPRAEVEEGITKWHETGYYDDKDRQTTQGSIVQNVQNNNGRKFKKDRNKPKGNPRGKTEEEREMELRKAVSLSQLKPRKEKSKSPGKSNLNELKQVLSDVLRDTKKKEEEAKKPVENKPVQEKPKEPEVKKSEEPKKEEEKKEVPEKVLRDVLDVKNGEVE